MNGYERHSRDYGGPPVGWGSWLILGVIIGVVASYLVLGLWRLMNG